MTINTVDSYRQNAEKTGRGQAKLSKEQNSEKQAQVAAEQEVKKDSVEISREGRMAAVRLLETDESFLNTAKESMKEIRERKSAYHKEFEELTAPELRSEEPEPWTHYGNLTPSEALNNSFGSAKDYLYSVLNGKVGSSWNEAYELAEKLGSMLYHPLQFSEPDATGTRHGLGREGSEATRAADREAGRNLAEYIASTYFDDPKEAQAFMEKINKYLKHDELQDLGWFSVSPDMEPIDWEARMRETDQRIEAHNKERYKQMGYTGGVLSEKGKELRAIHAENVASVKDIISKSKLITDFSSNAKWNLVKSLLG
ncbi:MAG: hypothetical protein FWC26_07745 [Fibromonadales bacterium]|nr:hypothetical protein [Fibromonadales bacterium]